MVIEDHGIKASLCGAGGGKAQWEHMHETRGVTVPHHRERHQKHFSKRKSTGSKEAEAVYEV